jgi:hypothetical protein
MCVSPFGKDYLNLECCLDRGLHKSDGHLQPMSKSSQQRGCFKAQSASRDQDLTSYSLSHGRVAGGPSRATMGRSPMDEKGMCKFCAIVTRTHSCQELETDVCQWKDIIIPQPTFSQYRLLNVVKAELTDPLRFFSLRTEERTTIPFPGSHFSSNEP